MRPCQRCGSVYWFRDHETANGRLARCARCDFVAIEAWVRDDGVPPLTTTSDTQLERLVRVMLPLVLRVEGEAVTVPTGLVNVARALEEELDGLAPSPPEVLNGDRISMGMGRFKELLTQALRDRGYLTEPKLTCDWLGCPGYRTSGDPKLVCDKLVSMMERDFHDGK